MWGSRNGLRGSPHKSGEGICPANGKRVSAAGNLAVVKYKVVSSRRKT